MFTFIMQAAYELVVKAQEQIENIKQRQVMMFSR